MTNPRRVFRFSFFTEDTKDLAIHQLRDGDAFIELAPVLCAYQYGGLLLNYPAKEAPKKFVTHDPGIIDVDMSQLNPSDLIVLTTRPALSDRVRFDKRPLKRSYNTLERRLFRVLEKHFDFCSRSRIRLAKYLARQLPPDYSTRADIGYYMFENRQQGANESHKAINRSTAYRKFFRDRDDFRGEAVSNEVASRNLTALYLVQIREAWSGGPGLLLVFGLGGRETLIWSYLLRTRFWRELSLGSPRFVMAEIAIEEFPCRDTPNITLDFVDDWTIKILLDVSR